MQDLNPQLQSKVFDSLLMHMKAERQDPVPAEGAGSGKTNGPKASKARAPRTSKSGSESSSGSGAMSGNPAWERLATDLRRLGLDKTVADALVSWANSQAEQSRQTPIKIRVLHPMEREFISVDAYDYILELYRLGLMDPNAIETLLENCAFLTTLPATKEQVQKMALRSFSEALEGAGLGSSH